MEKFPKKEKRLDFAKTLEEITKLAEEKLGAKGRKHFGAGEKVLSAEESKPFFIEQAGDEATTGKILKKKKTGPDEHEADPYNGDYLI